MEQVLILGLDIHGVEVAGRIQALGGRAFSGFVSDAAEPPEAYGGHPVYSVRAALDRFPEAGFIPLHVWKHDADEFAPRWVSFIDPLCVVSAGAVIEPGCILYAHGFVGTEAHLGRGVFALAGCVINHNCDVGTRAVLTSGVILAGSVRVGERAYIGQSATVRQFISIGRGAFVGMGAVVTRDIPDGIMVVGNPARPYAGHGT